MDPATKRILRDRAAIIATSLRKMDGEAGHLLDLTEPKRRPYLVALICRNLDPIELETFVRWIEDYDGSAPPAAYR